MSQTCVRPEESPMKRVRQHYGWWALIASGSFLVSLFTAAADGLPAVLGKTIAFFLWSFVVTAIPWSLWRLARKPLTPAQYMSIFTVVWLLLVASDIIVTIHRHGDLL